MNACFAPPAVILGLAAPGHLDVFCRALQGSEAGRNTVPLLAYGFVFVLNCVLESPGYWLTGRLQGHVSGTIFRQIIALNLVTHPLVYYAFPHWAEAQGWSLLTMLALAEAFAFSVEAALLRLAWRYPWRMAILGSVMANLTSWQLGTMLYDAGLDAFLF